jgi:hypothetical protein
MALQKSSHFLYHSYKSTINEANIMTKKQKDNPEEVLETTAEEVEKDDKNTEIFSRVFFTLLFALIGWLSLHVFAVVVIIQFGFLLITGQVNTNLKGFNKEVGLFLFDLIKYLSFQSNVKPFPFRDWPYDEKANNKNKSELNESDVVEVSK